MWTGVLIAVGFLLAIAFVFAPMVRDEKRVKPFRRPRSGTRHLHGPDDMKAAHESADTGPDSWDDAVCTCPHCGSEVEEWVSYCGECLNSV